jgi:DNA-binding NtrC family response regulator
MATCERVVGAPGGPVLIIEDDRDLRPALAELLVDEGFVVTTVGHPREAEALLRTSPFSLVLTDFYFGSLAESARAGENLLNAAGDVPVGCVSAWNPIPPTLTARYAFKLSKPIDLDRLLAIVGQFAAEPGRQAAPPDPDTAEQSAG